MRLKRSSRIKGKSRRKCLPKASRILHKKCKPRKWKFLRQRKIPRKTRTLRWDTNSKSIKFASISRARIRQY